MDECFIEPGGAFVTCPVLYNFLNLSKDIRDLFSSGKSDHNSHCQYFTVIKRWLKKPILKMGCAKKKLPVPSDKTLPKGYIFTQAAN